MTDYDRGYQDGRSDSTRHWLDLLDRLFKNYMLDMKRYFNLGRKK